MAATAHRLRTSGTTPLPGTRTAIHLVSACAADWCVTCIQILAQTNTTHFAFSAGIKPSVMFIAAAVILVLFAILLLGCSCLLCARKGQSKEAQAEPARKSSTKTTTSSGTKASLPKPSQQPPPPSPQVESVPKPDLAKFIPPTSTPGSGKKNGSFIYSGGMLKQKNTCGTSYSPKMAPKHASNSDSLSHSHSLSVKKVPVKKSQQSSSSSMSKSLKGQP